MDYIETVKKGKLARGQNFLLKYLEGDRLTQRQAILAKCYDCMGHYVDGRIDCGIRDCPLYPYMPFRDRSNNVAGGKLDGRRKA